MIHKKLSLLLLLTTHAAFCASSSKSAAAVAASASATQVISATAKAAQERQLCLCLIPQEDIDRLNTKLFWVNPATSIPQFIKDLNNNRQYKEAGITFTQADFLVQTATLKDEGMLKSFREGKIKPTTAPITATSVGELPITYNGGPHDEWIFLTFSCATLERLEKEKAAQPKVAAPATPAKKPN